jgi:hypothetical protein
MNGSEPENFTELMKDSDKFMGEVNRAVQNTLRVHKMLGYPVAVWRDGQVVWIPPEEIPINHETNGDSLTLPSY